uniref:Uncharacterized protein n=1 Tax=viral metagenome TaxID=1070528 RepID=A0A6C0JYD5_9ZZZZ
MESSSKDIHDVDLKLNSLSKDVEQIDRLCLKVTESIEKLQEVNSTLTKILVLHEEKHEQRQKNEDQFRIELKELNVKINNIYKDVIEKIDAMDKENLKRINGESLAKINKENLPIIELSKIHWMMLGGALTLGWLLSNVNLEGLAPLFK